MDLIGSARETGYAVHTLTGLLGCLDLSSLTDVYTSTYSGDDTCMYKYMCIYIKQGCYDLYIYIYLYIYICIYINKDVFQHI